MGRVRVTIVGSGYHVDTLKSWLRYVEDLVREATGCEIEVEEVQDGVDWPRVFINGRPAFEGLPDNEGTLAELLIHTIREFGCES